MVKPFLMIIALKDTTATVYNKVLLNYAIFYNCQSPINKHLLIYMAESNIWKRKNFNITLNKQYSTYRWHHPRPPRELSGWVGAVDSNLPGFALLAN